MNGGIRVVGGLIAWTVFAMAPGCDGSDEVLGTIDGRGEDLGGDDDGGVDEVGDTGDPDSPGTCFEIFGPAGISHSPPRRHDVGAVTIGDSRTMTISLYNFCSDPAARLLALDWPEGTGDFAVTSAPAIGDLFRIGGEHTRVEVTFAPLASGLQHARLRVSVSHGYYDFEFVGEGVSAGGEPAALDMTCLEPDRYSYLGRVGLATTPTTVQVGLPVLCDYAFGTMHLVVESSAVTSGEETFSLAPISTFYAGVAPNGALFSSPPLALPSVTLQFAPSAAGTYNGELTLQTNDRNGTYVVSFAATAD